MRRGESPALTAPGRVIPGPRLGPAFYRRDAATVARELLGQRLVRLDETGSRLSGIIVETEAYLGAKDRAAHSFGGRRTARNESMYAAGGRAYVYFTYGMHYCMNVVCGAADEPVAALLRALEPGEGIEAMIARRTGGGRRGGSAALTDLCSGPGKLCQALGIDRRLDGADLIAGAELWIERGPPAPAGLRVANVPRIGVDYAGGRWAARRLRWYVRGNPHVSRK